MGGGRFVALGLIGAPALAAADGRAPAVANVAPHPTDPARLAIGTTLGVLVRGADGALARIDRAAIGYGVADDPVLAWHPTRDELWVATFDGLRVSRDGGCGWAAAGGGLGPAGRARRPWIGDVAIGGDGRIWAATSSGDRPNDVYASDDGEAFAPVGLATTTGWWESVEVAPSDPRRVWVSGYRLVPAPTALLRETRDGGATWREVPTAGIDLARDPRAIVLGIAPDAPATVFVRAPNAVEPAGDAIYRTTDGGATWTRVLQLDGSLRGFAIAPDGATVLAGTGRRCADDPPRAGKGCLWRSTDRGATWARAGASPRMGPDLTANTSDALAYAADGALFAGGADDVDGWSVGRSTDGAATFTAVATMAAIDRPRPCPPTPAGAAATPPAPTAPTGGARFGYLAAIAAAILAAWLLGRRTRRR
jgi:photosystem II stability/assembly factor-like uncharacterized protein